MCVRPLRWSGELCELIESRRGGGARVHADLLISVGGILEHMRMNTYLMNPNMAYKLHVVHSSSHVIFVGLGEVRSLDNGTGEGGIWGTTSFG